MKKNDQVKINIQILNSLLLLHTNALRIEELDSNVLPLYAKYKIKHDVFTYQHLSKMYLNLGEYDLVKNLYKKMKQDPSITPN